MKHIFFIGLIFFLCVGCENAQQKKEKEIEKIELPMEVSRFDLLFYETSEADFPKLKTDFPYFFAPEIADSLWFNKRNEPLQQELFKEVSQKFSSFENEQKQLKKLFQHIKYDFPAFNPPKIITLISEVDYQSRVVYADSLLLVGLDNYLGENHHFYQGIQEYIRYEFDSKFLPVDVALAVSERMISQQKNITFLDEMIWQGKHLFLAQRFLPNFSEAEILKYSPQKYEWAKENQSEIWRYFIENQLLYSTDKKTIQRFISLAPFSKFYMEHDRESPGGIGRFVGLQIVKAFVEKNPQNFHKLLSVSAEELFKQANYKPKK